MPMDRQHVISAVVVLRPKEAGLSPDAAITADNVDRYAPAPEAAALARAEFQRLGFEVTAPLGISFSVTAAVGTFEETFAARLEPTAAGGLECLAPDGSRGLELPLDALPPALRGVLHAVTFTPPPDFGPTDF